MATFNLTRNSRVVFTTNVNATTGVIGTSGFTITNSQELNVLDGFSFSQSTNADTVTVSEAGSAPVRGQRSFNTSLNNVEFSFSTYIKPYLSTTVKADESNLWAALLGNKALSDTGVSFAYSTLTTSVVTTAGVLTLVGTAMNITGVAVNDIVIFKNIVGAGASELNTAARLTSVTGTTASATQLVFQYLKVPSATAIAASTTANWGATGVTKLMSTAWVENAAVAADTVGPIVAYSTVDTAVSNKNQLLPFGMIFTVDSTTYLIDNCAMDQATIDFGLDGIATVAWTGKGTILRQAAFNISYSVATDPVITGMVTSTSNALGTVKGKNTANAGYITNKLSTVTLVSNIAGVAGTTYTLALTGGSITIANGINYVIPANIGVVNQAIGYYTGTRAITGTLTAYLRTGSTAIPNSTAKLLSDILSAASTATEPKYKLQIEIGGASNAIRVETLIDGCNLQVPTVDAQAVMSTSIGFTAQGYSYDTGTSGYLYDLESTNDLRLRYFSN